MAHGSRIEHRLNAHKVVEFDTASTDFAASVKAAGRESGFARSRSGKIVLQDHASQVWFRNIRIRHLE